MVLYEIFDIDSLLVSSGDMIKLQKSLFSHTFSRDLHLFFLLQKWKQFKQQKPIWFFDVIPLNNADTFFTPR